MNGIISTVKSIYVSGCLFVGFTIGVNPEIQLPQLIAALQPQEISIHHLAWIANTIEAPLKVSSATLTPADTAIAGESSVPASFEVIPVKLEKTVLASHRPKRKTNNLKALERLVLTLEESTPISPDEFEKAALNLRTTFSTAIVEPKSLFELKQSASRAPHIELVQVALPNRPETREEITQSMSSAEEKEDPVSRDEAREWTEKLLSAQLAARLPTLKARSVVTTPATQPSQQNQVSPPAPKQTEPQQFAFNDASQRRISYSAKNTISPKAVKKESFTCRDLSTHQYIKVLNNPITELSSQICPEKIEWLSKSWRNEGWVKATLEGYFPTISRITQEQGKTLMLDENALADLALKGDANIIRGAGLIIGSMPEGYKVEFLGRSEETQYFELNGSKYFAIINAEPGSGVIELASQTKREIVSSLFVPVLEDTISYVELIEPVRRDIRAKVIKNDKAADAEVTGLVVAISTQAQNQAITLSNGSAVIKNVYVQPHYPIFLDVTSNFHGEEGYRYRYEVNPMLDREHSLSEIADATLHKWLKQLKTGLSDQSAMVVGFYDRKKLNGFKEHHFVSVNALNGKFGLEPQTYSVLWNGQISHGDPLEGDLPRFMSVQVPEGLGQTVLHTDQGQEKLIHITPISPRVIHVIQE